MPNSPTARYDTPAGLSATSLGTSSDLLLGKLEYVFGLIEVKERLAAQVPDSPVSVQNREQVWCLPNLFDKLKGPWQTRAPLSRRCNRPWE